MRGLLRVACCVFWAALGLGDVARAAGPEKIPDLLPPRGELTPTFWELHGWQCILAAIGLVGLMVVAIVWLRRPKVLVPEPPGVLARQALGRLRGQVEDGALVMNVSRILKRYVMAALQLPAEELTTTEFRHTLQSQPQINPELAAGTGDFLRRCDEWKFAAERPAQKLNAVEGALQLVEKIESSHQPVAEKEAVS